MSEQVLIQFRADKDLKQKVSEIYAQLGLDLPTALRIFMKKSMQVNGIPFSITLPNTETPLSSGKSAFSELRKQAAELPVMSLQEINNEIAEARSTRKVLKDE